MSTIVYNKLQLIERIQNHMANGWPGSDSVLTKNIVLLYIDQAAAYTVVGQVYANAKVEGSLVTPEAWLTTYNLSNLQQDSNTGDWFVTLPQPPVSLPLGYSITNAYFAKSAYGKSQPIFLIRAKRVAYMDLLPSPTGTKAWVENSIMWLRASNNQPLLNENLYVQMVKTRTDSLTEAMDLPDDAIQQIFTSVIGMCKDRLGIPQDTVLDGLPAGSKAS